jgi:hypothetical protein
MLIRETMLAYFKNQTKTNSVALVRKRTIPTERPRLVGEVSANFCGQRVSRGQRNGSPRPYSRVSRPEPLLFLPSSSWIVLEAAWTPFQIHFSENLVGPGIEPGTSGSVAVKKYSLKKKTQCTLMLKWVVYIEITAFKVLKHSKIPLLKVPQEPNM